MPRAGSPISVLFRCDGGPVHGFGHVSRCVALADAFSAAATGAPLFLTFSPDGAAKKFIADRGFTAVDAAGKAGSSADLSGLRAGLLEMPLPRLAVIDSREIGSQYCRSLRDLAIVLCLDDEECRNLACDILVNSHPWIDDTDYPNLPGRVLLTGPRYNTLSSDIFCRTDDRDRSHVERILITLGGEDPHDHTSWFIENCADLLTPFTVDIVVGPAHPDPQRVRDIVADLLPSANLSVAPSGLGRFIQSADIAISAGGITCYELAAAGVPTLAIMVEDHQNTLIASLERHGCLIRLGGYDDLTAEGVRRVFSSLVADGALRTRLSTTGVSLFAGPGGETIAEHAAEFVLKHWPRRHKDGRSG